MTGYYTEIYFHNNNIRYIAVNDNIDTLHDNNDVAPFKNILNDMYAKDISKKIKSAKRLRMYKGYYIACQPPYSYKVDPSNPNHLVINEKTCEVVKLIFTLALSGLGVVKITRELNNRHIDNPCVYKAKNGDKRNIKMLENLKQKYDERVVSNWNTNTVGKILRDVVYIGNMENHKYEVKNYKTKKRTVVPKDERIVVENTHEAIITKSDYDKVQDLIKGRQKLSKYDFPNLFKKLLTCENCGRVLTIGYHVRRTGEKVYSYQCCDKYQKNYTDTKANSIRYSVIYQIIDSKIRELFDGIKAKGESYLLHLISGIEVNDELESLKKQKDKYEKRLNVISNLFTKAFEEHAEGTISIENYQSLINKYQDEQKDLNSKLKEINNKLCLESNSPIKKVRSFHDVAKNYLNYKELTKEMIHSLIDHVVVGNEEEINGKKTRNIKIIYRYL